MKKIILSKLITSISIGMFSTCALFSQELESVSSIKIVNGSDAFIENHPYQVDVGGCGGAVLSANWIITAAHCIFGDGTNIIIRGGYTKRSEANQGQAVRVKRAILDPNSRSDIALLELETPLDLSGDLIKPILYASPIVFEQGLVAKDEMCVATGWGLTDPNNTRSTPDHLQMAVLKFGDVALSDNRIRVEEYQGRMACNGDSGGPLVVESIDKSGLILVGTVSGGEGDPCSDYGFWGNVAKASEWIEAETEIKPYEGGTILSVNDRSIAEKFAIWPVPADDKITINSELEINNLGVYDLSGKKLIDVEEATEINVSNLSDGTYILVDEENFDSRLFVVHH